MTTTTTTNDSDRLQHRTTTTMITTSSTTTTPSTSLSRVQLRTLLLGMSLGLVSGTLYAFGRYASDLKAIFHLTQLQVSQLGILLDTGNYLSHPFSGYVYDRYGPRTACTVAAVVVCGAYTSIQYCLVQTAKNEDDNDHEENEEDTVGIPIFRILQFSFFFVGGGSGLGYIVGLVRLCLLLSCV